MNKLFWKNKRVLVTGHTGFKGSWLCLILLKLGSKVHGISLKEKKNSLFDKMEIKRSLISNNYCDINNQKKIKKLILKIKPEIVFHFAAQSIVSISYKSPLKTIETNILGTSNVLNSLKDCKSVKTVIVATSDKCYDTYNNKSYVETDKLGGDDIYSASKACTEIVTSAFRKTFYNKRKIKLASVRAGNVIGGGDYSKDRIFPDVIKAYFSKNYCIVRNKNFTRPWQHVLDPLSGYLKLAVKLHTKNSKLYQSAWNFGPNYKSKKVYDLVKEIQTIIPIKLRYSNKNNKINETKYLGLNSSKAKKYLDWKPKISFKETVRLTVSWYINQKNKVKLKEITEKQINIMIKK